MPEKPVKRMRGRPKQAENDTSIQQKIIFTASALFKEYGYEAVTLQQIGKRCGVSKPTIYYHFASKPELFKVAMTTMLHNVRNVSGQLLAESGDLEQGLVRLAEARLASPHAEIETMMREAKPFLESGQLREIREAEQQTHELLAGHFRAAMDGQFLREEDPLFLAETFSTLMLMGNRENASYKYESPLALAQKLVAVFLQGAKIK